MEIHDHTPADGLKGVTLSSTVLRGDSNRASAALTLARHVRTKGLRRGSSDELVGLVLELIEFAESANYCGSPLIGSPAVVLSMHMRDRNWLDPRKYADSLVLLARDVDAHPWGAFGISHPSEYLPFLQQLAGDLMGH